MGFGFLFLGNFFFADFYYKDFDILPDFVGLILVFIGLLTLSTYGCGFDNLKRYMYLMFPLSLFHSVLQILLINSIDLGIYEIWSYVYTAIRLVYTLMLLVAIYRIANDTEVHSIAAKAQRNMVLFVIYNAIVLFLDFPAESIRKIEEFLIQKFAFGLFMFIVKDILFILNLVLIYSCYMWICKEGDEDMPEKERKFFKKKGESEE